MKDSVLFGIPWGQLMAVTHHKSPDQFRRCSGKYPEHVVETTWHDNERDAAVARKFNLWSSGCRSKTFKINDF